MLFGPTPGTPSVPITPIPQEILDKGWTKKVHVEGWNKAFCFFYVGTDQWGVHTIRTQVKPIKTYQTRNNICYTRKYDPNAIDTKDGRLLP